MRAPRTEPKRLRVWVVAAAAALVVATAFSAALVAAFGYALDRGWISDYFGGSKRPFHRTAFSSRKWIASGAYSDARGAMLDDLTQRVLLRGMTTGATLRLLGHADTVYDRHTLAWSTGRYWHCPLNELALTTRHGRVQSFEPLMTRAECDE